MKHIKRQRTEADALKAKFSAAAKAAMQADADASKRLETCLAEERQQASMDRKELLSQITELIQNAGQVQDGRWASKINAVREDIAASRTTFQQAEQDHDGNMEMWSKKENLLVEEILKSRDTLKGKMKNDWTVRASNLYNPGRR